MTDLLFLAASLIMTAVANVLLKLSYLRRKRTFLWLAILLFVLTSLTTSLALRSIPLDSVYMATALTIILVMILSTWLLGEKVTGRSLLAVGIILTGVVVFNL